MERWAVLILILNGAVPIVALATPARFTVGHYSTRVFIIAAAGFGVAAYLVSLNSSFTHARRRAEGLAQALTLTLSNTRTPTGLYQHRDDDWRLIEASAESTFPDPAPAALQDLLELTRFTHAGRSATVTPGELGRPGGGRLSLSAQPISEDQVLVSWRDASGQEQAQRLSERVDTTSAITGQPNRTALLRDLDERAKWGFRGEVLAVIDIDDFRSVNDALGSGPADAALGEVGRRLAERNPGDLVAHLGDSPAILHDGEPGASAGVDRAIRSALAEPIPAGPREVTLTASVGYARPVRGISPPTCSAMPRPHCSPRARPNPDHRPSSNRRCRSMPARSGCSARSCRTRWTRASSG
ncbi:MAG: GGDEF domain-containing protein [Candidatus Nanopelagicales bacterium]